ncbi:hypothetical protein, partial [Streptomyces sp. SA3_actF]|uniref:hypothetical protein n=1 Tax=Streptomyces sp. SA3_actF TaxID=682181 RepID=UPI001F195675
MASAIVPAGTGTGRARRRQGSRPVPPLGPVPPVPVASAPYRAATARRSGRHRLRSPADQLPQDVLQRDEAHEP